MSCSRFSLWSCRSWLWLISECGKARCANWIIKESISTTKCACEFLASSTDFFFTAVYNAIKISKSIAKIYIVL